MIDTVLYIYTFFSSIPSIRGYKYKYFQMFDYKKLNYDRLVLMKQEENEPEAYEDLIRSFVAPNKYVINNAQALTGETWTSINRRYCVDTCLTVPHHQHQNYCEGVGGNFKLAFTKLLHNTPHTPLSYWCFAANCMDKKRRFLSEPSIDGRCGYDLIKVETEDISIFKFHWFEPI